MIQEMDCSVARADLAAALGRMAGVAPTRSVLPVLDYVRVSPTEEGTAVLLEATDLDRRASVTVPLAEPCGAFVPLCLPMATLYGAAKAFPGVQARLHAVKRGVELASGASKITLPTLPAKEFPELTFSEGDGFAEAGGGSAESLLLALSRTVYAVAVTPDKPSLHGVSVGHNGSGFVAVATSGHVLSKEHVVGWGSNAEMEPATIATVGVATLLRFFAGSERLTVERSSARFRFTDESDAALIVPTLPDPFPNIDALIGPREPETTLQLNRTALVDALRRVQLVQTQDNTGLRRTVFTISKDGLSLEADSERGSASETIVADVTGNTLRIGLNSPYVLETLASIATERVVVEMTGPQQPTFWRGDDPQDAGLRLIMPLRLL